MREKTAKPFEFGQSSVMQSSEVSNFQVYNIRWYGLTEECQDVLLCGLRFAESTVEVRTRRSERSEETPVPGVRRSRSPRERSGHSPQRGVEPVTIDVDQTH